jgi:hypothetical protein
MQLPPAQNSCCPKRFEITSGRGGSRLAVRRCEFDDAKLPVRQGAGLVEDDGVKVASFLESPAVTHQEAALGAECRRDGHNERNGKTQRVWARDSSVNAEVVVGEGPERD